jgi:hypothetical protein
MPTGLKLTGISLAVLGSIATACASPQRTMVGGTASFRTYPTGPIYPSSPVRAFPTGPIYPSGPVRAFPTGPVQYPSGPIRGYATEPVRVN